MIISFSDGVKFDTSGSLRVVRGNDGHYVIGEGMLIPVDDEYEGQRMIELIAVGKMEKERK